MARWRRRVWARVRDLPLDLVAVVVGTALATAVLLLPVLRATPLRWIVTFPLVLLFPGWAFIAAMFPERPGTDATVELDQEPSEGPLTRLASGIDGIERFGLSVGFSVAIVAFVGLALNLTPFGIRFLPSLLATGLVTVALAVAAAYRRLALPPEERYAVPIPESATVSTDAFFHPASRTDAVLNGLLALSIVLAASGAVYALTVPNPTTSFTELYLLNPNGTGNLTADTYPTEFVRGEPKPLVVGVGNHEIERINYTVVVQLQRVSSRAQPTVLETAELGRLQVSVPAGETVRRRYAVSPTMTGTDLRLEFLLYQNAVPASPSRGNADEEVHLYINVSASTT